MADGVRHVPGEEVALGDIGAAAAARVVGTHVWGGVEAAECETKRISGGITNELWKVSRRGGGSPTVAVRVFGAGTEVLLDREKELRVVEALDAESIGAGVLLTFANGRVERFLEGRTLDPPDLARPEVFEVLAPILKRLHGARVDDGSGGAPQLWAALRKMHSLAVDAAETLAKEGSTKASVAAALGLPGYATELEAVRAACDALGSPTVFAHNDLLSGNVLRDDATGALNLIDFEYAGYSLRGYDIANHFNEWCGFECEWERYPTAEQQNAFFTAYLGSGAATTEGLAAMRREAAAFSLASHLFWGLWAVVQAKHSTVDFDYLSYAELRLAEYRHVKEERLAAATVTSP